MTVLMKPEIPLLAGSMLVLMAMAMGGLIQSMIVLPTQLFGVIQMMMAMETISEVLQQMLVQILLEPLL